MSWSWGYIQVTVDCLSDLKWVLRIEPGSSGKEHVLLTAEPASVPILPLMN